MTTAIDLAYSVRRALKWWREASRWDEWYDSKIPFFFVMFNYLALVARPPASCSLLSLWLQTTLHFCLYMAFGYCVNDFFDREADLKAGKVRPVAQLPAQRACIILLVLLGLGAAVLLPLYSKVSGLWLIVLVNYLIALSYSVPPVRLKERGLLGVVVAAASQRPLPALTLAATFRHWEPDVILMLVLFFIVGLRWILVHQLLDLECDRNGGVHTWATAVGDTRLTCGLRLVVFPLELLIGFLVLLLMTSRVPWLALALLMGLLQLRSFNSSTLTGFRSAPLARFYFIFWPLFLAVLVGLYHISSAWLLLVEGLWLQKGTGAWCQSLRGLIPA